jgi:hypothetical protein
MPAARAAGCGIIAIAGAMFCRALNVGEMEELIEEATLLIQSPRAFRSTVTPTGRE